MMLAGTGGNTNRRLSKGTWGKGGPTDSNSIKCKVFLLTHVEKERMERQTSILSTEPGSNDWESSALNTKPVLGTEVCLPILPYVLPAVLDYSVNFPLTDLLCCQSPFRGQPDTPLHQGRSQDGGIIDHYMLIYMASAPGDG